MKTDLIAYSLLSAVILVVLLLLWEKFYVKREIGNTVFGFLLQVSGMFFAIALALEQTNYDRNLQRIQEAQAIAVAGASSLVLSTEKLDELYEQSLDIAYRPEFFAIPSVVEKLATDEKFLSMIDLENMRLIVSSIENMKNLEREIATNFKEDNSKALIPNQSCNFNGMIAKRLNYTNDILKNVCYFFDQNNLKIPQFLLDSKKSGKSEKDTREHYFTIKSCKVSIVTSKFPSRNKELNEVLSIYDGEAVFCSKSNVLFLGRK